MPTPKSIVLLSGGLDSTVLMYSLRPNVKAILFNYGQRHVKELLLAVEHCNEIGVEFEIADLTAINPLIRAGSQSGDQLPPDGHYAEESMKVTIVPNRNAIMLSIACGWAVATGCKEVFFAAHGGDHAIYPDCRGDFVERFAEAMKLANAWNAVQVRAPFVEKSKAQIVRLGNCLYVPFEKTWSCYKGEALHCGKCGTCTERREAFILAGVTDPTKYSYTGPLMEATK